MTNKQCACKKTNKYFDFHSENHCCVINKCYKDTHFVESQSMTNKQSCQKEEKASIQAMHYYLNSRYGKPKKCENPHCELRSESFDWCLKTGHKYSYNKWEIEFDKKWSPDECGVWEGTEITLPKIKDFISKLLTSKAEQCCDKCKKIYE